MAYGKLITIEGTEGAGKSTAIQFIQQYLVDANLSVVLTREPGGTIVAEEIRHLLLHPGKGEIIQPETELLLMFAGRAQHIHHCILPALQAGKWVVSDRYVDASYAYQGGGRNLPIQSIQLLDKMIVKNHYPDLTLLLDVPAEVGLARAENRGLPKDRIEQERVDFFVRVRQAYLDRAKQEPNRIKVIDASLEVPSVERQIKHLLDQLMRDNP